MPAAIDIEKLRLKQIRLEVAVSAHFSVEISGQTRFWMWEVSRIVAAKTD